MSPTPHVLWSPQPPSPSPFSTFWWGSCESAIPFYRREDVPQEFRGLICSLRDWSTQHPFSRSLYSTTIMEPCLRAGARAAPTRNTPVPCRSQPAPRARAAVNSSSAPRTASRSTSERPAGGAVLGLERAALAGQSAPAPTKGCSCRGEGARLNAPTGIRRLSGRPAPRRRPASPARPRPP